MAAAYFLESVDRVMKVLDAFTAETPELRLTDLSERLGIPKPQVLRIVSTLDDVEQHRQADERDRLGVEAEIGAHRQLDAVEHESLLAEGGRRAGCRRREQDVGVGSRAEAVEMARRLDLL